MTIRLKLPEEAAELVTFGCSPAYEVLRSLHVLHGVKHHPLHISWTLRTRDRMSPELREEAKSFAFWYLDRPLIFREIWPPSDISSWTDELSALRAAPVDMFADQLIHGALVSKGRGRRIPLELFLDDRALQDSALARIAARHPASLPVMRELISDPERTRERFADFLASYWRDCVGPDWPGLEAHLLDDIGRRGLAMSRRGPAGMLAELSAHIHADPHSDEVVIRPPGRPRDAEPIEIALAGNDCLLLAPSHFVWPELSAVVQRELHDGREQQTVVVTYALAQMRRQGQAPAPAEDLLKLLRAAGDPTRLRIMQLLAGRPRSTRELAGVLGLTDAAISKHLKLLQEAGWVESERRSYYAYYHLVRDSRGRLTEALEHLLG